MRFCHVDPSLQNRAFGFILICSGKPLVCFEWEGDRIKSRFLKMVGLLVENGMWKDKN